MLREGAMSFQEHLAVHGELASARRGSRNGAPTLIDQVEAAGLRGRGGGFFPTAVKMRAVLSAARGGERRAGPWFRTRRPIVVVNAVEGEPASAKDKTLLEALPHLVLDGGALAAQAIGADAAIVCLCEQAATAQSSVTQAIRERPSGADGGLRWHLASVPSRFVAGQESALVNFLSGGPATPSFTPPLPFEYGVRGRPTLVNNPETLAHLALIGRHGPDWFRSLGSTSQPGSTLLTLHGPVAYPGVYEVEHGAPLSSLLEAAGGGAEDIRAVLMGGYAGTWIDGRDLDLLALCDEGLARHGAQVGSGVVILLGESSCGLGETARVVRWLAQEGAGQCGPCTHGLDALAGTLERVLAGEGDAGQRERLAHLISIVEGRGACRHPDATVRLVASTLEVFADELAEHLRYGPCAACAHAGALPIPAARGPRATPEAPPRVRARRRSHPGGGDARARGRGSESLVATHVDRRAT
jgi:NADH:ubiquinone oxidoreductase subunit F (NADH-binding)